MEGWICPRCSKVWAPAVKNCDCHLKENNIPKINGIGKRIPDTNIFPVPHNPPPYDPLWGKRNRVGDDPLPNVILC